MDLPAVWTKNQMEAKNQWQCSKNVLGIPLPKEPGLLKEGDCNLGQEIFMMLLGNVPQSKESKQKIYWGHVK